jgi:hypothetical protein
VHPQREYSVISLHQLRSNLKKAWPAMMQPNHGPAWLASACGFRSSFDGRPNKKAPAQGRGFDR